jgi:hypothetical protein
MFISKQEKVGILSRINTLEETVRVLYAERRAEKNKAIKEPEPDPFDFLETIFPRKKRSSPVTPYGTLCSYTYPFVEDLKVGEKVEIPAVGNFTADRIQRSITSYLHKKYGKKSYQTRISRVNGNLEIVRIA